MAKIAVNSTVLAVKSDSLKSISTQISTVINEMKNEINKLKTAWEGEAAETTVNKFMSLSDTFAERYETVNEYSDFLRKAAEEMKRTEEGVKAGANSQAGQA